MLRIIGTGSLLAVLALCGGCFAVAADPEPLSRGTIEGTVILGIEPIAYAHVEAFRLDERSGAPDPGLVAMTDADSSGHFKLDMGAAYGTILLVATGGQAREHWHTELLTLAGDAELSAVIPQYWPATPRNVVISPFTTMAAALARGRLAARRDGTFRDAAIRAHELMNEHLDTSPALGLDILETQPADVRRPASAWNAGVAHGLALAGLSTLAGRIAEETPDSSAVVNTITLTAKLAEDASAGGIFDGNGGELDVGVCIPPPGCTGPDCQLCRLGANTLRRDLAESLLFWFVPSEHNGTGRDFMDVARLALGMAENMDPDLFGPGDIVPLDPDAPAIAMQPSQLRDERGDAITFTVHAEPVHEPLGTMIDLNVDTQCPTVYKHVNRMDDASQNPLRWRLSAIDAGVGVKLVEYRVRELFSGAWLTEWMPVAPVAPGSQEHAIVLLRRDIPALATMEGVFEIQIRARDWFENVSATVSRCWQHVPLAAPLRVLPAVEATGPGSLHAVSIHDPDTFDLSMLINATTAREIMWFEVQNGTDDPVYVTFDYAQPSAEYDLTWQRSNVELSSDTAPPGCTITLDGTCPDPWPAEYESDGAVLVNQRLPGDAWNLRILDITTGMPVTVNVCEGCDANEYQFGARVDATRPRRYKIALVIDDLSALAPKHPLEEMEQYDDIELAPSILPGLFITGKRYGTIFKCKRSVMGICEEAATYRHYRAIRSAALRIAIATITGRVAPTADIAPRLPSAQSSTFGVAPTIPSFTWSVDELALPDEDP
jgi:hypothetical protein